MSNRLPIETTIEGEKITKVCVEDVHKLLNRIIDPVNDSYSKHNFNFELIIKL